MNGRWEVCYLLDRQLTVGSSTTLATPLWDGVWWNGEMVGW